MIVEWASIYIIYDVSIKSFRKAWTWHVVPVSNDLMDTESEFAPLVPSKAHIVVSIPESCDFFGPKDGIEVAMENAWSQRSIFESCWSSVIEFHWEGDKFQQPTGIFPHGCNGCTYFINRQLPATCTKPHSSQWLWARSRSDVHRGRKGESVIAKIVFQKLLKFTDWISLTRWQISTTGVWGLPHSLFLSRPGTLPALFPRP